MEGEKNWRSEMDPEMAGAWRSTVFEGSRRSSLETINQRQGPTYAGVVLQPKDLNRDCCGEVSRAGRYKEPFHPRSKSRKRPGKELSGRHHLFEEPKCHKDLGIDGESKKFAVFGELGCLDPETYKDYASEEYVVPVPDGVKSSFYAGAAFEQRDFSRDRGRDMVNMPVRVGKPRFRKIKPRKLQKKQNKPKKDEPTYAAILKRDDPPLLSTPEFLRKPDDQQIFAKSAEEFALGKECSAMMAHLDLNRCFERMSYTEMLRK